MKYIKHKELGFVPVVEVNDTNVIWDDNQWSGKVPLHKRYEIAELHEFDLDSEFEAPSLDQEFSTRLADHEILLSFNEDEHAEYFGMFWQQEGLNLFAEFVQKNQPEIPF